MRDLRLYYTSISGQKVEEEMGQHNCDLWVNNILHQQGRIGPTFHIWWLLFLFPPSFFQVITFFFSLICSPKCLLSLFWNDYEIVLGSTTASSLAYDDYAD